MNLVALRTGAEVELERKLARELRGEVRFDSTSRAIYATDASNYRQVPIGVVLPKDAADVVATLAICRELGAPVLARGGGTSLAGQCCNVAVVMDFTKYMRGVLQVDVEHRRARVLPGTVLDELRKRTEPFGLTFGPDPATHDHCTLGGMIGNNSCGVHAVMAEFYGPGPRTADNVQELEVMTYDGVRMRVGPTPEPELSRLMAEPGRPGEIFRSLVELRDRYAPLIRERFPDIPRRVSGYNLPALLPERGFDLARALVGSEGTCVTVLEATLSLVPLRGARALVLAGFEDVFSAAEAIPAIRELKPVGCEGMDDRLVCYNQKAGTNTKPIAELPPGQGWLLVEFGADRLDEAVAQAEHCVELLARGKHRALGTRLILDPDEQHAFWELRESGLGTTAFVPGQPDTWEGWEDAAVPPERLSAYLREYRALCDRYGFRGALYGHFAQGCVHTRIDFDLTSRAGIDRYLAFTSDAADLVLRHGGSLSGEHGDGQSRADLLEKMFGPELLQAFREFKKIWDPDGKLNPGKLVDAYRRDENLRLGADFRPWQPKTYFAYEKDGGSFAHAARRCVGVGKCRHEAGGTMCPSFMATHDELHSTRGRAHLLFEMVKADFIQDGWQSEEVKQSLELCLSCKGCKRDCPVGVDVATYKAEFLSHYYAEQRRPRYAYAFGLIHGWARLAALAPRLANFATHAPGLERFSKWIAGAAPERDLPRFAPKTFRAWFRERPARDATGKRVLLWPDTFNDNFHPETLAAAVEVLEAAGFEVIVPEKRLCCGRPLYDYGMLERAKRGWRDVLTALGPEIERGTLVVGIEPSCVAAFRDELVDLFPDDARARRLSEQTLTLAELLARNDVVWHPPALRRRAIVHSHCHQKAVMGRQADLDLLREMQVECEVPDSGCCGMAGAFGFERDKYALSMAIGERVLLPKVRSAGEQTLVVADGFSCRHQIETASGRRPLHLAEVIQLALHQDDVRGDNARPEDRRERLLPRELRPGGAVPARVLLCGLVILLVLLVWRLMA